MASQTDIVNRALTKLGAARITNINDSNKSARAMNAIYDTVRKSELRKHMWGFALKRDAIAKLADAPAWGFGNQYQLPTDFLRLVQINDTFIIPAIAEYTTQDNSAWAIEGTAILTDFDAPLKIRYVRDIIDAGLYDPLFVESFAAKLAYEACEEITNSNQKRAAAMDNYKEAIREAVMTNAIERPPQGIPDDSWMVGRL